MKSVLLCTLLVFLLGVTSTYAGYCRDRHPKPEQGTCNATGTSDMAELMKYLLKGKTQYFIGGSCEGIYGVWGFNYKCVPGKQARGLLYTSFAYILELPSKNGTQRVYYAIQLKGCPAIYQINYDTRGNIPGTSCPWVIALKVIKNTCNNYYPGKCNVVPKTESYIGYGQQILIDLTLSNLISMRAVYINGVDDYRPRGVAKRYGLAVEQTRCGCTYMQEGYTSVGKNDCQDPNPMSPTIGSRLCDDGFGDAAILDSPGALCAFVVQIASYLASKSMACDYGLVTGYLVQPPYDGCYQMKLYLPSATLYALNQPFFGCC